MQVVIGSCSGGVEMQSSGKLEVAEVCDRAGMKEEGAATKRHTAAAGRSVHGGNQQLQDEPQCRGAHVSNLSR